MLLLLFLNKLISVIVFSQSIRMREKNLSIIFRRIAVRSDSRLSIHSFIYEPGNLYQSSPLNKEKVLF